MKFVNLFISPSGRINRAKFWIAILLFTVLNVLSTGMVLASGSNTLIILNGSYRFWSPRPASSSALSACTTATSPAGGCCCTGSRRS